MLARARWTWLGMFVLLLGACERAAPPARNDTTTSAPSPRPKGDSSTSRADSPWDDSLGVVFLVPGQSDDQVFAVVPAFDSTQGDDPAVATLSLPTSRPFSLFGAGRLLGETTLGDRLKSDVVDDCSAWPLAKIVPLSDQKWSVGFERGHVLPLATDSLASLGADSLRVVRAVIRAASSTPGDTTAALRGIPFQVRRAHRLVRPNGSTLVLAEVLRSLNQEASPIQEHMLLVLESDSTTATYVPRYAERTVGTEESTEATELLFAGQSQGREFLLLARYVADGVVYALLQALESKEWRLRWSSLYTGC